MIGATEAWSKQLFDHFGDLRPDLIHEDHALVFRSLLLGRPIAYVDEPLVSYRQGTGISTIYGSRHAMPAERRLMLERYLIDVLQKIDDHAKAPHAGIAPLLERAADQYRAALRFEEGWPSPAETLGWARRAGLGHVARMAAKRAGIASGTGLDDRGAQTRAFDGRASAGRGTTEDWREEGIESLGACPVCQSAERDLLHGDLRDRIFFCSPGKWKMWVCRGCGSGYLDPRPTEDTIHLAYREYYTHEEQVQLPAGELRGLRWLQRVLANGYKNWKFGTDLQPSSWLGVPVALLMPVQRAILDRQFRHLPPRAGGGRCSTSALATPASWTMREPWAGAWSARISTRRWWRMHGAAGSMRGSARWTGPKVPST